MIPFKYVALFLTDLITPRYYFTHIYPRIVLDGLEEAWRTHTIFIRACITRAVAGDDTSVMNSAYPMPPARNTRNTSRGGQLFYGIFPAHLVAQVNITHDEIHQELIQISDQSAQQHQENT